jgi:hypothetical protein
MTADRASRRPWRRPALQFRPSARQHLLGGGALVFGAEHGMLHTQRLQAQAQRAESRP